MRRLRPRVRPAGEPRRAPSRPVSTDGASGTAATGTGRRGRTVAQRVADAPKAPSTGPPPPSGGADGRQAAGHIGGPGAARMGIASAARRSPPPRTAPGRGRGRARRERSPSGRPRTGRRDGTAGRSHRFRIRAHSAVPGGTPCFSPQRPAAASGPAARQAARPGRPAAPAAAMPGIRRRGHGSRAEAAAPGRPRPLRGAVSPRLPGAARW